MATEQGKAYSVLGADPMFRPPGACAVQTQGSAMPPREEDTATVETEADGLPLEQQFPRGLPLLAVGRRKIAVDSANTYLEQDITISVPADTKVIHISPTTIEMEYGPRDAPVASQLGIFWLAARQDRDPKTGNVIIVDGKTTIHFQALLQDKGAGVPISPWSGRFVLEIMCFG